MLRYARIVAGMAVWVIVSCSLVSYGMTFPSIAWRIERMQFMTAAMAFAIPTVVFWLVATLAFGRVYCSVACPLGVWQDIMARLPRLRRRDRRRRAYHYSPALTRCRNITLVIVVVALLFGVVKVSSLVNPWNIYTRTCVYLVKPVWGWMVNLVADPQVKIVMASVAGLVVALVSIVAISILASLNGRTYCNSICPVGTALGFVSKYSIFHIDIDTDKCIQCRKCEHVCKSSCIDLTSHVVDSSRCVACFDCLPVCPNDAIHYTWLRHQLAIPMMQKLRPPLAGGTQCMDNNGGNLVSSVKSLRKLKSAVMRGLATGKKSTLSL